MALAADRSRRAMLNTPVIALRTDRLNAVGETGSPALIVRRMSVVRRNSPCRDANTTRTPARSPVQSCATLSAARDSVLRRRRTIGSIKPISGAVAATAGQEDQRATGMVQCRSGISVFARLKAARATGISPHAPANGATWTHSPALVDANRGLIQSCYVFSELTAFARYYLGPGRKAMRVNSTRTPPESP